MAYGVLYKLGAVQTAATFNDEKTATAFRDAVHSIGAERAMKAFDIGSSTREFRPRGLTVSEWVRKYIDSRTGIVKSTRYDYELYLRQDIEPSVGKVYLSVLSHEDIADWVQGLEERDLKPKTIANRHGFLSAALNAAVRANEIPSNPAAGMKLPSGEKAEMCFLTEDEYALLRESATEYWRPMLDFMVVSGVRLGELAGLKPTDVDRNRNTVHIGRSRKRTYDSTGYEIGPTKTKKSNRTISVDPDVLDALDYTKAWLFTNTAGNAIHAGSFRNNVWYPTVARAQAKGLEKKPRIHDMRHTAASWMVQGGESLAVVQAHLGHENINTTIALYSHLDRKTADAAAGRLGKRLKRESAADDTD